MKRLLLIPFILALCACVESRKDTTENVVHHDHLVIAGTMSLPGPSGAVAVPVHLTIDHDGTDRTTSHEEKTTTIDAAAIGREIAGALGPVMSVAGGQSPLGIAGNIGQLLLALAGTGYVVHKVRKGGVK